MRLGRLIGNVVVVAALGAAAFWWRADIAAFAVENQLVFAAGLAAAALVLVAAVLYLGAGLRHQRMLLREARRVASMNRPAAEPTPNADAAASAPDKPDNAPLMSLLGTIDEVKSRREGETVPVGASQAARLAPQLYYQPVVSLDDGTVRGYDVFRKVTRRNLLSDPGFTQVSSAGSAAQRAAFEYAMIEAALAAARQVFSEADGVEPASMLYVHVSDALTDNQRLWTQLAMLMRAHPALSAQITLCVADYALADPPPERLDAIDKMLDADAGIGVSGLDFAPRGLPQYIVRALQIAMYRIDDLRDTDADVVSQRSACMTFLLRQNVPGCARLLASDADIVDAIEQKASFGAGPVYAEPMRLRDEPRLTGQPGGATG